MGDHSFRSGSGRLCLDFVRTLRHRGDGEGEIDELPDMAALNAWVDEFGPTERAAGPMEGSASAAERLASAAERWAGVAERSAGSTERLAGAVDVFSGENSSRARSGKDASTSGHGLKTADRLDAVARELREAVYRLIALGMAGGDVSVAAHERAVVNRAAEFAPPSPRLDETGQLRWHADQPAQAVLSLIARDALDLVTSPLIHRVHECANPACAALFLDSSRPGSRRWCSMNTCGNQAKKQTLRSRATTG